MAGEALLTKGVNYAPMLERMLSMPAAADAGDCLCVEASPLAPVVAAGTEVSYFANK